MAQGVDKTGQNQATPPATNSPSVEAWQNDLDRLLGSSGVPKSEPKPNPTPDHFAKKPVPKAPEVNQSICSRLFSDYNTKTFIVYLEHKELGCLQIPLSLAAKKGRFEAGALKGDYEVRHLYDDPKGNNYFYVLYFDGTGENVQVNGKTLSFRKGVFGFQFDVENYQNNRPEKIQWQAPIGDHTSKDMTVRAPTEEYHEIAKQLYDLRGGFSKDLKFLSDLTDKDLLDWIIDYALTFAKENKSNRIASRLSPVFSNSELSVEKQKEIFGYLFDLAGKDICQTYGNLCASISDLNGRFYYGQKFIPKTLNALTAIYEVAREGLKSKDIKTRIKAIQSFTMLRPEYSLPELPKDKLDWVVSTVIQKARDVDPNIRLAAYQTLHSLLKSSSRKFITTLKTAYTKSKFSPEKNPDVATARLAFESALLGKIAGEDKGNTSLIWKKRTKLLAGAPLNREALKMAIAALDELPPEGFNKVYSAYGPLGYSYDQKWERVKYTEDQIKYATTLVNILKKTQDAGELWNQMAAIIMKNYNTGLWSNKLYGRLPLYDLVESLCPDWKNFVSANNKINLDIFLKTIKQRSGEASPANTVFTLEDFNSLLGLDPAVSDVKELEKVKVTNTLEQALLTSDWKSQARIPILERLLKMTDLENNVFTYRAVSTNSNEWFHLAYEFAERFNLGDRISSWLSPKTSLEEKARLIWQSSEIRDHKSFNSVAKPHLVRFGKELIEAFEKGPDKNLPYKYYMERAIRELIKMEVYGYEGKPDAFSNALFGFILEIQILKSAPDGIYFGEYNLEDRVSDLKSMLDKGHIPTTDYNRIAEFFTKLINTNRYANPAYPAAKSFQNKLKKDGIPANNALDKALADFIRFGHFPATQVTTVDDVLAKIKDGTHDERVSAMRNAKYIVVNREWINEAMKGTFDPANSEDWDKLAEALVTGEHDHAEEVASEARRSMAYAQFFLIPEETGEGAKLYLVSRGPSAKTGDLSVFMINVDGEISDESAFAAKEVLSKLPREHTARFLSVEGHTIDPQKQSENVVATTNPDSGGRNVMRVYKDIDVKTAFHEVVHPMWYDLPKSDQDKFIALHNASKTEEDYADAGGMANVEEDFASIGAKWGESSSSFLDDVVMEARMGNPVLLQKLIIFLEYFARGHDTLPAYYISTYSSDKGLHPYELKYTRNADGKITSISETVLREKGKTHVFEYDKNGYLVKADYDYK